MGLKNKILLLLILSVGFLLIFYANINYLSDLFRTTPSSSQSFLPEEEEDNPVVGSWRSSDSLRHEWQGDEGGGRVVPSWGGRGANSSAYNLFVIYTKATPMLQRKYELLLKSLFKYTTSIPLHLHVITDSRGSAEEIARRQMVRYHRRHAQLTLLDVDECVDKIRDIVQVMMPHFSSHPGRPCRLFFLKSNPLRLQRQPFVFPGSYYSDALFYISLGMHRIVDPKMHRGILVDCDVVFRSDAKLLFDQFHRFTEDNLFGLAPELTPVYRHILYRYRAQNPGTILGSPYYPHAGVRESGRTHGYPGLNSGVVLLDFDRMRSSSFYAENLDAEQVQRLVQKYHFRGHLGDQDFYTLLGYEFPSLVMRLDCAWNRQLCLWWKDHGYSDVFDTYFHCEGRIRVYHGNCNTRIPE